MKIVIQCAARKNDQAGRMRDASNRLVEFVADPNIAPVSNAIVYAKPDDVSDGGLTWRERLVEYNRNNGGNPLDLFPAYQLYANPAYRALVEKYGAENVFILSAGWGLIGAEFLTPRYDITFSTAAKCEDIYKRRRKSDSYADFCFLPDDCRDDLVFFGGKDYLPLFDKLTSSYAGKRHIFYNSSVPPSVRNGRAIRFQTSTRTNWHYECVSAFIEGRISL